MKIKIQKVRSATNEEWDYIWQNCDYATYFHSREWAEIWKEYSSSEIFPIPKIFIFTDGKKALLPLSCRVRYRGRFSKSYSYLSSPAGTYGGWISLDAINEEHNLLIVNFLKKSINNLYWRINPYQDFNIEKYFSDVSNERTYIFKLKDGYKNFIYIWKKKGRQHVINRLIKKGYIVKIASCWNDWLGYFKVYLDSLHRWGTRVSSRYNLKIFREIFEEKSPYTKLWLCFDQNKIISGSLCFYSKRHVVFWHSGTSNEYYKLSPISFIKFEVIKDAFRRGYWWVDMNPSGGHKGVEGYKRNLGAYPLVTPVISWQRKLNIKQYLKFTINKF